MPPHLVVSQPCVDINTCNTIICRPQQHFKKCEICLMRPCFICVYYSDWKQQTGAITPTVVGLRNLSLYITLNWIYTTWSSHNIVQNNINLNNTIQEDGASRFAYNIQFYVEKRLSLHIGISIAD